MSMDGKSYLWTQIPLYQKGLEEYCGRCWTLVDVGMVARDGIEPPTPAFSGPRSTAELSGLGVNPRAIGRTAQVCLKLRWAGTGELPATACRQTTSASITNRGLTLSFSISPMNVQPVHSTRDACAPDAIHWGTRISSRTLSMIRTARLWPLVPFLIASLFFTVPRLVDAQKAAAQKAPAQKPSVQKATAAVPSPSSAEARTARAFDEARKQGP